LDLEEDRVSSTNVFHLTGGRGGDGPRMCYAGKNVMVQQIRAAILNLTLASEAEQTAFPRWIKTVEERRAVCYELGDIHGAGGLTK